MEARGIVLTFQMGSTFSGEIDPKELRKHLLYWDFIDFPTVNGIGSNLDAFEDTKLLKQQGFIKQTKISVQSSIPHGSFIGSMSNEIYQNLLIGQYKVVEEYYKNNIICSISQYNVDLEVPQNFQEEISILEMELINCLPYPSDKTQIEDILEFKEKRKDELIALRYMLDGLYIQASANINNLRTKNKIINDLKVGISDINKLFDEKGMSKSYSAFKVLLKIPFELYSGYLLGKEAASTLHLSLYEGGVLGALAAAVLLDIKPKQIFGSKEFPDYKKDFAYLYYAKKEL